MVVARAPVARRHRLAGSPMSLPLWLTYFSLNAAAPREIPWEIGADLPSGESRRVVPSLQEFQLGESSDGARLLAAAAAWAVRHDEPDLPRVMRLFVAEERRHAAELARFLSLNGHGLRRRSAGDSCFRLLRRSTGGLEASLSVLLTAEIVGYVYYQALRAWTGSALLRAICDTFLRDEAAHLIFHMERLARIRRGRSRAGTWATQVLAWSLLAAACAAVWPRHRSVLRRGGLTLRGFLARCFARLAPTRPERRPDRRPGLILMGRPGPR